jgi:hypothetical protein
MAVLLSGQTALAEGIPSPFDRTLKAAPIVLQGTISGLKDSGDFKLKVDAVLKGSPQGVSAGSEARVDVSVAPVGAWPTLGMKVVMALVPGDKGGYRLYSRFGSLLPAEPSVVASVKELLGVPVKEETPAEPAPVTPKPTVTQPPPEKTADIGPETPVQPAVVHVLDTIESQVLAAELIATGRVVEVGFSKEAGERAILKFVIDEKLLGGGVPDLIEVHVPAPDANFAGELPAFRLGKYCLFLKSRYSGGGLNLVSPYYGVYYLEDSTQEALLKEKIFDTSTMRAKKQQGPILTTIQATIGVWQEAWNAKNLARLITCYAKGSDFRKMYDAGGKYRMALDRKLREFPGTVTMTVIKVRDVNAVSAKVDVELLLEVEGAKERRPAEMSFTKEDGEWRIIEEGF